MGGSRNGRHTVWTRLTGLLTLAGCYLTGLSGILLLPMYGTFLRTERVALAVLTAGCALLWMAVSALTPDQPLTRFGRRGDVRLGSRPAKALGLALGFGAVLLSGAALGQAVGPDGETGRWMTQVYDAGGGTYPASITGVLSTPHGNGIRAHRGPREYTTVVAVTVPFASGPRSIVVHGATTSGRPVRGDQVNLVFAPDRPDLGVRGEPSPLHGTLLFTIWVVTVVGGWNAGRTAMRAPAFVHHLRRFRADVHVPAALLLALGGSLLLPVVLCYTGTALSWLLASAAATTPWLALGWAVRRIE